MAKSVLYAGFTYEKVVRSYAQAVAGVCMMQLQNHADALLQEMDVVMHFDRLAPEETTSVTEAPTEPATNQLTTAHRIPPRRSAQTATKRSQRENRHLC